LIPIVLFFPKVELCLEIFKLNRSEDIYWKYLYLWLPVAPGFACTVVDAVVRKVVYAANADSKRDVEL
jgi:hypothetical protein